MTTTTATTLATPQTVLTDQGTDTKLTRKFEVTGAFEVHWTWDAEGEPDPFDADPTDLAVFAINLRDLTGTTDLEEIVEQATSDDQGSWKGDAGAGDTYTLAVAAVRGAWDVEVIDLPS